MNGLLKFLTGRQRMRGRLNFASPMLLVLSLAFFTECKALDMSLMDMSDKLDKIEKQDFQAAIGKSATCVRTRNFACAETELAKAAKLANTPQDRSALTSGQNGLKNERQQMALEIRLAEEARQAEARKEEADRQQRESDARWAEINRQREEEQRRAEAQDPRSAGGTEPVMQGFERNAGLMNSMTNQIHSAYAAGNRTQTAQTGQGASLNRTSSEPAGTSPLPPLPSTDFKFTRYCIDMLNANGSDGKYNQAAAKHNAWARQRNAADNCVEHEKRSGPASGVSK